MVTYFNIALWVLTIHSVIFYNLQRRISKQEQIIKDREDIISAQGAILRSIDRALKDSSKVLKDFDSRGIYQSDDETGTFFKMIKDIQEMLVQYFTK